MDNIIIHTGARESYVRVLNQTNATAAVPMFHCTPTNHVFQNLAAGRCMCGKIPVVATNATALEVHWDRDFDGPHT